MRSMKLLTIFCNGLQTAVSVIITSRLVISQINLTSSGILNKDDINRFRERLSFASSTTFSTFLKLRAEVNVSVNVEAPMPAETTGREPSQQVRCEPSGRIKGSRAL